MVAVRVDRFTGEIPTAGIDQLPQGAAQRAQGVWFHGGGLRPHRMPKDTGVDLDGAYRSIFRFRGPSDKWLGWFGRNVRPVVVAAEGEESNPRLFWTDGGLKWSTWRELDEGTELLEQKKQLDYLGRDFDVYPDGRLLVSTLSNLFILNRNNAWTSFTQTTPFSHAVFDAVSIDVSDNQPYATFLGPALGRRNVYKRRSDGTWSVVTQIPDAEGRFSYLASAPNGDLFALGARGVYRYDGTGWEVFTAISGGVLTFGPTRTFTGLAVRTNGDLLVADQNRKEVFRYRNRSWSHVFSVLDSPQDYIARGIAVDSNNRIILAMGNATETNYYSQVSRTYAAGVPRPRSERIIRLPDSTECPNERAIRSYVFTWVTPWLEEGISSLPSKDRFGQDYYAPDDDEGVMLTMMPTEKDAPHRPLRPGVPALPARRPELPADEHVLVPEARAAGRGQRE